MSSNGLRSELILSPGKSSRVGHVSTGTVHKQRASFGPTVTLVSKHKQDQNSETGEHLQELFLMALEVTRLREIIAIANKNIEEHLQASKRAANEISVLREQTHILKEALQRGEVEKVHDQQAYHDFKRTIGDLEVDNKALTAKVQHQQAQITQLNYDKKEAKDSAERANVKASNMEMSIHTTNELHKSKVWERAQEIDMLKANNHKLEEIVRDQEFLLQNQKRELHEIKARDDHATREKQQMTHELLLVKDTHDQLMTNQRNQEEEKRILNSRNQQLEQEVERLRTDLRAKTNLVTQLQSSITDKANIFNELERRQSQSENALQSYFAKEEGVKMRLKETEHELKRLKKESDKKDIEINLLKSLVDELKKSIRINEAEFKKQYLSVEQALRQRESSLRKAEREGLKSEAFNGRLHKSASYDSMSLQKSVSLNRIMDEVEELKVSNTKTSQLLQQTQLAYEHYYKR